jgi:hypothetical protein
MPRLLLTPVAPPAASVTQRRHLAGRPATGRGAGAALAWAAGLLLACAAPAQAANYRTCIKLQIRTLDSGLPISSGPNAGGSERHYATANAGIEVIARGVRVQMSRAGWSQVYNAEPATGCFNWSHASSSGFSLRVYGLATVGQNNLVRIHNAPTSFASYPGSTYSILRTGLTPTAGGTDTYAVGSHDPKWTAFAVLAFGLYRYNTGLANKSIHVGLNSTCDDASAHFGQSNSAITEGRHYLVLGNCPYVPGSSVPQTMRKFIVTHELGHAIAALYYGDQAGASNGGEPAVDVDHPAQGSCTQGGDYYSMRSVEWNSVNFREGFAHFIASAIWNEQSDTEAAFRWFESSTHDLERWGYGAGTGPGGRLENSCGAPLANAGTNEDWMRFFWDFYTNTSASCPQRPSALQMLQLYATTRLNGGLTGTNYYAKMRAAAQALDLPACVKASRFDDVADFNGINH